MKNNLERQYLNAVHLYVGKHVIKGTRAGQMGLILIASVAQGYALLVQGMWIKIINGNSEVQFTGKHSCTSLENKKVIFNFSFKTSRILVFLVRKLRAYLI